MGATCIYRFGHSKACKQADNCLLLNPNSCQRYKAKDTGITFLSQSVISGVPEPAQSMGSAAADLTLPASIVRSIEMSCTSQIRRLLNISRIPQFNVATNGHAVPTVDESP